MHTKQAISDATDDTSVVSSDPFFDGIQWEGSYYSQQALDYRWHAPHIIIHMSKDVKFHRDVESEAGTITSGLQPLLE